MSELHVVFKVGSAEYVIPAASVLQMESYVGATPQSLGTSSINLTVPAKHMSASFIVQGVAVTDPDDPCVVTVSAATFGTDTIEIDVKEPGLRLRELGAHHSELGPNDEFFVDLGVPDGAGRGLRYVQQLRRAAHGLFLRLVVAAKREVADDPGGALHPAQATHHALGVVDHGLQRDAGGARQPLADHAQRIADQDALDPGGVRERHVDVIDQLSVLG